MTFDLENMDIKIDKTHGSLTDKSYEFLYNDKRYYYKNCKSNEFFNELIAEKIAKRLNIPCCHYILTYNYGIAGVSSEMFDTTNYVSLREILRDAYGKITYFGILDEKKTDGLYKTKNSLEDIWMVLYKRYNSRENAQELVNKLMTQIVRVFLFDVVIANSDRHTENIGFIEDGENVELAPLFDNDYMLSDYALYDNDYSMYVESGDYFAKEDYSNFGTNQAPQNTLEKFLNVSASEYKEELIEMLKAISKESLEEIFNELEIEGICIDSSIREKYIKKFELNQKIINKKISGKRL